MISLELLGLFFLNTSPK